eukprot:gene16488-53445_t
MAHADPADLRRPAGVSSGAEAALPDGEAHPYLRVGRAGAAEGGDGSRGLTCTKGLLRGDTVFEERPAVSVAAPAAEGAGGAAGSW